MSPHRPMDADGEPIDVLLVDDETELAELAAQFLEEDHGLDVVVETRGDAALERFDEGRFDCVVVDFKMPGMDGVEFLRSIRAAHPELPVILYTGQGDEEVASEAISAGVTDYVLKGTGTEQYDRLATKIESVVATYRAERRVAAERRRHEALVEHSTDVIAILDPDGTFTYLSPSIERETGHQPEDLVGENAFEYIHPEDRDDARAAFEAGLEDPDTVMTAEFRFRTADDGWIHAAARGRNRLDDPTVEGFVVNARDVTERVEQEEQLRRERALTRGIIDAVPDIVFAFDEDGDPIVAELIADDIAGYSPEEVEEMDPLDFVPESDRGELSEAIGTVLAEGGVETRQSDLVTKDGDRVPHEFKAARLEDEDGNVLGVAGVARDVSDRLERESELERRNERLEEFTSIVSHDLRSPLNVAQGNLELALDGDDEALETASVALDRMEHLIEDLLALAKQGRTIEETGAVDLADIARRAWESVEHEGGSLQVTVDRTVLADADRLRRLFENLLRNAIEHGSTAPRPGAGDEAVEHGDDGDGIRVRVGPLDDGFFVEDDGPGIPESEREQVFDRGYAGRESEGTGFGLAIVEQIADAHGWDVAVVEGSDGGARFEFTGVETTDDEADVVW